MSQVKVTADSGGGTVSLKAPASTTGDAAVQLTLPVNDGDANQYLKTDGSGALSWSDVSAGAALTGSTNNTITTVTGANAIQGEANLTFTGTVLGLTGKMNIGSGMAAHDDANDFVISNNAAISGLSINNAADGYGCVNFGDADDNDIGRIAYNHNGNKLTFAVNAATRMEIESDGDVKLNTGTLSVEGSGKGISVRDAYGSAAPIYPCRAWCVIDGDHATVYFRSEAGFASITDVGAGNYTATLDTTMPDTGGCVQVQSRIISTGSQTWQLNIATVLSTTQLQIDSRTIDNDAASMSVADGDPIHITVFR